MAQPQAPVGGLNQTRPAAPPAPPKQENLAARASGMEQEQSAAPEDFLTKSLRDLQVQREALNATAQRLKSSLDTRMGLPFDPTMMAAAAGFLKPTKTGSFGESLGYAAEGMSSEAEKQFARKQAAGKMEFELQQKLLELAQQGAITGHRMNRLGVGMPGMPGTPGVPSGPVGGPAGGPVGGPVGGAPAGAPPAAAGAPARGPAGAPTAGATPAPVTATGAPRQQALISDKDIEEAYALDPTGKYGKELAEIAKMQREDIISTPEGPYSRSRQQFLPQSGDKIVEVDFGRFIGTKKVPFSIYNEWKAIHERAVAEQKPELEINWFKSRGWLEGKPSAPAEPGKPPAGGAEGKPEDRPLTVEERKRRDEIVTERGKSQIAQEKEQIGRLDTNFTSARELINTARGMREIATSNSRAFDLMNDDGIAAAVARAAQKGIQAGNFGSISIPSSELASYKLSKEDREALQMFAREYANLTVQFRKAARVPGEGATTEREGDLYAALGAMPTDTARVIRLKSEFIELKGRYDQEVFKAWSRFSKNPENSYRDFLASDQFNKIADAYDARLGQIQKSNAELFRTSPREGAKPPAPAAQRPQAAPAAAPAAPASQPGRAPQGPPRIKSRDDVVYKNVPVGGLYVDVDGTVRTKKAGE